MPVILALLLLLVASSANAVITITDADRAAFDAAFVGGPLMTTGPRTGGCAVAIHPRLLLTSAEVDARRADVKRAGTFNAAIKTRLESFWNLNHNPPYPPLPSGSGGDHGVWRGGNCTQAECAAVIGNWYLDEDKVGDFEYAAECTTCYGIMLLGRSDDPGTTGPNSNESLVPIDNNWPTGVALEGTGPFVFPSMGFLYDIIYDELSPTMRTKSFTRLATARLAGIGEDSGGGRWQWTSYKLGVLLSIYGDEPNFALNYAIRDSIISDLKVWEQRVVPCLNAIDDIGYNEHYFAARHNDRLATAALVKACLPGYSSPLLTADAIVHGGRFYRFMTRPETYTVNGAQKLGMERGPDKYDTKGFNPTVSLSFQDHFADDKEAWILANYYGSHDLSIGPNNTSGITSSWWAALWNDPLKYTSETALSDLTEHYAWNPTWGIFVSRSQWNEQESVAQDVKTSYWGLYLEGAGHRVAGSWDLNVGGDNLWRARGCYSTDVDDEYQVYHAQAISRNTISILQYGESSFDGATTFNVIDKAGASSCSSYEPETWPSLGYQIKGDATLGLDIPCLNGASGVTRPQMYVRGANVQAAMVDGVAYYVASDYSKAYNLGKQDYARRAWYSDGAGLVVVLDQTRAGDSVADVLSGYHTINAPLNQAGSVTVLRGGGLSWTIDGSSLGLDSIRVDADGTPGDTHGGIYRIDGNTIHETSAAAIKTTNGAHSGWTFPLEIRNATAETNGFIYCIGGPNKLGQHWMETKYPCVEDFYTNTTNATKGTAFELWAWSADAGIKSGWNACPSSHANGAKCSPDRTFGSASIDCSGVTRFRSSSSSLSTRIPASRVALRNSNFTGTGAGDAVGDWSTFTAVADPLPGDLVESFVACVATTSGASKPTVKYTHTGEIVAVAVNQGAGYTVHVVPTATFGPRATTISWDNPLTSEDATYKAVGAEPNFVFDLRDQSGAVLDTLTADDQGFLTWTEAHDSVTTFTLGPHDPHIVYPPPTPPPGPVPYTLANTVLYHPRERTLLQAGGGTLLLLYYGEGAYGAPIWAQLSRDDGQTWRDLDGAIDSATELVVDEEVAGPNIYTPRGDYGFSAAIDPVSNDLWIVTPAVRLNGSHTEMASLVRAKNYAWTGTTWSTLSSYTYNGSEVALASKPRDCVARVTAGRQLFAAWTGPSGANWSIQSVRIKSGTATALSAGAALASSSQSAQLLEYPRGTVWLLASVRSAATDDSIRVRTATDGGSAQWGATSRIAFAPQGTLGQWGACVGPSGPWIAAKDAGLARYRYAYWTGSGWTTGLAPVEPTAGTEPSVTAAGATRVVLTSRYSTSLLRAYWSLSDGWSAWEDVATLTGLSYSHVVSLRPTDLLAVSARTGGFTATPFSLPAETVPTGACCSGTDCTVETALDCTAGGGTYVGDGEPCDPNPCEGGTAFGACCMPDGSCHQTVESGCDETWQHGVACDPNPCPSGPPSLAGRRRRVILAASRE